MEEKKRNFFEKLELLNDVDQDDLDTCLKEKIALVKSELVTQSKYKESLAKYRVKIELLETQIKRMENLLKWAHERYDNCSTNERTKKHLQINHFLIHNSFETINTKMITHKFKDLRPILPKDDGVSTDIVLGVNGTTITRLQFNSIDWTMPEYALIRTILIAVFGRETLTTHSLSGKRCKSSNMTFKPRLDVNKVQDIVSFFTRYYELDQSAVRTHISHLCTAANRTLNRQQSQNQCAE